MTFSICARHPTDDGVEFGIGIATDAPAVGALAPYVSHEGAISTQSFVNVRLGRRGVDLLADLAVDDALDGLLAQDDHSELRQVHGVDARGNVFAFSGDECDGWFGHETDADDGVTIAGNMLAGEAVIDAVGRGYRDSEGANLVEKLLDALAAGEEAGGDKRGHTSAAVAVKAPQTTAFHDLRVDYHETPIDELGAVYEGAKSKSDGFSEDSKSRIFD